jgi:hypothetical protein
LSDVESDHVHPSPSGEQKVASLLAAFFAAEPAAAAWWPAQAGTRLVTLDASDDSYVSAAAPGTNFDADSLLLAQGGAAPVRTYLRFDASAVAGFVHFAKLSLRVFSAGGGAVQLVPDDAWNESSITYANAPALGPVLTPLPQSSRDGTIGADVTDALHLDADGHVSFALTTTSAGASSYHDEEAGDPPRLVLVVATGPAAVGDAQTSAGLRAVKPNPTSGGARIVFESNAGERGSLEIYSITGRRVRTLARGAWNPGRHESWWDGLDERGRETAPGVYFARLRNGAVETTRRIVRVR